MLQNQTPTMPNVKIHRYVNPEEHGWSGYVEPDDRSWITFVGLDRVPRLYPHRDPETGAILPDDPAKHAAHIKWLRDTPDSLRVGMRDPQGSDGLAPGERVFPLGVDGRAFLSLPASCAECGGEVRTTHSVAVHLDCDHPEAGAVGPDAGYAPLR